MSKQADQQHLIWCAYLCAQDRQAVCVAMTVGSVEARDV